ncbi:MAG: hypothetical protein U5O39_17120 [Gammaproteobacteria bacterium]|nr:hypothetical protein [Gammaproteobacteria bacterium]
MRKTSQLIERRLADRVPVERLAAHFHNTYGCRRSRTISSRRLQMGVAVVDAVRLPVWVGARTQRARPGNVATEDVVYMLSGMGSRPASISASWWIPPPTSAR